MKILISNDGMHAHYYERLSWTNAFNSTGLFQAGMYDARHMKDFDIFDSFEPDIFIGQLYNMSKATLKCIQERPHMRVILRAGEYNDDNKESEILQVTDKEVALLNELVDTTGKPDFIYTHYLQEDIVNTHKGFADMGIKLVGVPMCADIHTYGKASYDPRLKCDIGFVGGYWPYKAKNMDPYLRKISERLNTKIFSHRRWPDFNEYSGPISDKDAANLFRTALVCPNLSEPHALKYGIDVNERAFKVLAANGFCIMDNVRAAKTIFKDGVVFVDNVKDFVQKVHYYIDPANRRERQDIADRGREIVMKDHTNYNRASLILESLEEDYGLEEINSCLKQ